jgi:hypothetical protein
MKRALAILTPFLLAVLAWAANDIVLGTLQPGASGPSWRLQGTDYVAEWGTTAPASMPTGLVAHWKMNDDAANTTVEDSAGDYDGVATSNTALLTIAGKIGKAFYFSNTNHVRTSYLGVSGAGPRTMCAWFKYDGAWANEAGMGYGYVTSTPRMFVEVRFDQVKKKISIEWAWDNHTMNSLWPTNVWAHFAFAYDGKTGFSYLNGVLDKSEAENLVSTTNVTHPFCIGAAPSGYVPTFIGAIDDVRFYERCLTTQEIALIYNGGAGTED